jgi:hypothetical protein
MREKSYRRDGIMALQIIVCEHSTNTTNRQAGSRLMMTVVPTERSLKLACLNSVLRTVNHTLKVIVMKFSVSYGLPITNIY